MKSRYFKLIALSLIAIMAFSLFACAPASEDETDNTDPQVTLEEWKSALELHKLNSFTMEYESKLIYAADEEWSEEVISQQVDATVKYKDGDIYMTVSKQGRNDAEPQTDCGGGHITFDPENLFREVDWFSKNLEYDIQPAELLDDSVYDWEENGYNMATYNEESRSYVIEMPISETASVRVELKFSDKVLVEFKTLYSERYMKSEANLKFSDVNAGKPIAEITSDQVSAKYDSAKAGIANAKECTSVNLYTDETVFVSASEICAILDKITVQSVEVYKLNDGKLESAELNCTVEGVEYEEGDTDTVILLFDVEGRITMIYLNSWDRMKFTVTY